MFHTTIKEMSLLDATNKRYPHTHLNSSTLTAGCMRGGGGRWWCCCCCIIICCCCCWGGSCPPWRWWTRDGDDATPKGGQAPAPVGWPPIRDEDRPPIEGSGGGGGGGGGGRCLCNGEWLGGWGVFHKWFERVTVTWFVITTLSSFKTLFNHSSVIRSFSQSVPRLLADKVPSCFTAHSKVSARFTSNNRTHLFMKDSSHGSTKEILSTVIFKRRMRTHVSLLTQNVTVLSQMLSLTWIPLQINKLLIVFKTHTAYAFHGPGTS